MKNQINENGPGEPETYEESERVRTLISLLSEKDGMKRQGAREALVAIGEHAVEPLKGILGGRTNPARWEAAKALAEIGSESSTNLLVSSLEDDDSDIAWLAAEGLISIGVPSLGPLMQRLLANPDSHRLRDGAHHVLHDLRNAKIHATVKPLIKSFLSKCSSEEVELAANQVLRMVNG